MPTDVLKMNNEGEVGEKIRVRDSIRNPDKIKKKEDIGMILKG